MYKCSNSGSWRSQAAVKDMKGNKTEREQDKLTQFHLVFRVFLTHVSAVG